MQTLQTLGHQYSHSTQSELNDDRTAAVPEKTKLVINYVIKSLAGIFPSLKNTTDAVTLKLYRQELTQAFLENEIFNQAQIEMALISLRKSGGSFPPSVPDFINLALGLNEEGNKPPEHVWFDRAKALPEFTPEQNQKSGLKGVALARQTMREARARKYG
jgi:hypothetical protein